MKKLTLLALVSGALTDSLKAIPCRDSVIGLTAGETLGINVANPQGGVLGSSMQDATTRRGDVGSV